MKLIRIVFLWALFAAAPAFAAAATITHDAVGCVVVEEFPRLVARVSPMESVGRARVVFRAEGSPHWYAVAMSREGDVYAAALPKPKASLHRFQYYIEVADTA